MLMRKQTALAVTILITAGFAVSACSNTMKGAGRDIENAGEAVQDAAQ